MTPTTPPTRTSPSRAGRALVLGMALGMAACSVTGRNPFAPKGTAETQLLVQIENQGFNDLRLCALSSRGSQSLGSISGNTVRRVTLEWRQTEQLSFRMDVLAGRSYTTHTVSATPGDRVYLTIPSDPAGAYLRVR